MNIDLNTIFSAAIVAGLGALIGALAAGRKTRSEARKLDADTAQGYQKLAADMEDRYTSLLAKWDAAQADIARLRADVDTLKTQVHDKDATIERLTRENIRLGDKVQQLTKRVRELETQLNGKAAGSPEAPAEKG